VPKKKKYGTAGLTADAQRSPLTVQMEGGDPVELERVLEGTAPRKDCPGWLLLERDFASGMTSTVLHSKEKYTLKFSHPTEEARELMAGEAAVYQHLWKTGYRGAKFYGFFKCGSSVVTILSYEGKQLRSFDELTTEQK
jgi:hypothetical protein